MPQSAQIQVPELVGGSAVDPQLRLTDVLPLERLQQLQDAFAEATGVASIMTDPAGHPITRPSRFSRLCSEVIRGTERGLQHCLRSDAILIDSKEKGPSMRPCMSGGLWDGGASIWAGDIHLANWLVGQVRNEDTPLEFLMASGREMGLDEAEFRRALAEVPLMPTAQFARVCDSVYVIANHLSDLAFQNLALRKSESSLRATLDSIGDAVITTDLDGRISRMNPIAEEMTGWKAAEAVGQRLGNILDLQEPETGKPGADLVVSILGAESRTLPVLALRVISKQGRTRRVSITVSLIHGEDVRTEGIVVVMRDESAQVQIQEQLHQHQKMEAVGQLAGGVAHDFNNMLQGIMGAAEILSERVSGDPSLSRLVGMISGSADRAADLTRKLLDFSRRGQNAAVPTDVHAAIRGAVQLLERSIDRKIVIESHLEAEGCFVSGDRSQLENLIINLGVNARDAMPEGGRLRIRTRNLHLEPGNTQEQGQQPGAYLEIQIQDTGVGIPDAVLNRIFEPFFTTKAPGKGTGLGLASVYGAILDHQGIIHVESQVGVGTSFRIQLPVLETSPIKPVAEEEAASIQLRGTGTILVVEDETVIRQMSRRLLNRIGYEVIEAKDGAEGVELFFQHQDRIRLVLLDMIMPRMSGKDVFEAIRAAGHSVPIILASGFLGQINPGDLQGTPPVAAFLPKPYRKDDLIGAVVSTLAQHRPATRSTEREFVKA